MAEKRKAVQNSEILFPFDNKYQEGNFSIKGEDKIFESLKLTIDEDLPQTFGELVKRISELEVKLFQEVSSKMNNEIKQQKGRESDSDSDWVKIENRRHSCKKKSKEYIEKISPFISIGKQKLRDDGFIVINVKANRDRHRSNMNTSTCTKALFVCLYIELEH